MDSYKKSKVAAFSFLFITLPCTIGCGSADSSSQDETPTPAQSLECYKANPTGPFTELSDRTEAEKACESRTGTEGYDCFAHEMGFEGDEHFAFVCQPGPCAGGDIGTILWLGPNYGCVSCSSTMYLPGWISLGFEGINESECPQWTAEGIDDALAMDVSDEPCEKIADYRTCVRSITASGQYCVPNIQTDDATRKFETSRFTGCTTMSEECL